MRQIQLTWQVSPRHKLGVTWQEAVMCFCPQSAPDVCARGGTGALISKRRITQLMDQPVHNRLLFEVSGGIIWGISNDFPRPFLQPGTLAWSSSQPACRTARPSRTRAAGPSASSFRSVVSYITGAHAVKVGLTHRSGSQRNAVRRGASFMPDSISVCPIS